MTAPRTPHRPGRLRLGAATALLAAALAVLALVGLTAMGLVAPTEAGYVSAEQATLSATAGTVQPAVTVCTPVSGAPNQLTLAPPEAGLPVTGYRITITVDPIPEGSYAWQTGTRDGIELLPIGESVWPATQTLVGWGIELPPLPAHYFAGSLEIVALGPGGWESSVVRYTWSIEATWVGANVACTPQAG